MTNRKKANLVAKARGLLIERGWCQNDAEDKKGRLCAVGSINVAAGVQVNGDLSLNSKSEWVRWSGAHDIVRDALRLLRELPIPVYLAQWNDQHGRKKEHVLDLFDQLESYYRSNL
jgi:hypothetical protein